MIAELLASRAKEDHGPLDFEFPDDDLICISKADGGIDYSQTWRMYFDLTKRRLLSFLARLNFDCTNNIVKYKTCVIRLQATMERKVKFLKMYNDFALVIHQLQGE